MNVSVYESRQPSLIPLHSHTHPPTHSTITHHQDEELVFREEAFYVTMFLANLFNRTTSFIFQNYYE